MPALRGKEVLNLRIVTPESVKFQNHIRHVFLISGKEGLRPGKTRGLLPVSLGVFPAELLKRLTAFFIPGAGVSGIFPEDFQKRFKLFDGTGKERKKIGKTQIVLLPARTEWGKRQFQTAFSAGNGLLPAGAFRTPGDQQRQIRRNHRLAEIFPDTANPLFTHGGGLLEGAAFRQVFLKRKRFDPEHGLLDLARPASAGLRDIHLNLADCGFKRLQIRTAVRSVLFQAFFPQRGQPGVTGNRIGDPQGDLLPWPEGHLPEKHA